MPSFNPSLLPALILSQPVPAAKPDDFFTLLAKFMAGTRTDIRDASQAVAGDVRKAFALSGGEVQIDATTGDVLFKMEGAPLADEEADVVAEVYGGVSAQGALSFGIQISAMDRQGFAALLDFAAAGLAAMDSHALQNGWQRS